MFLLDNVLRNAAIIVMVAFGAHGIKEVSRTQLAGAIKIYASAGEKKDLLKLDKKEMILPVAEIFIKNKIVKLVHTDIYSKDFSRDKVFKTGIF